MRNLSLRTIFISFVLIALFVVTVVSALINTSQFSRLYYQQTEKQLLPDAVGIGLFGYLILLKEYLPLQTIH